MNQQILGSGKIVSELDIRRMERKIGLTFPAQYRFFLVRHNGGRPVEKYFKFTKGEALHVGKVLDLFGIDDPVESCNIEWNYEVYRDRMPSGFLPIGCEDGGNIICMKCVQPELGAIYYWDHDDESAVVSFKNMYKISESLDEFLSNLTSEFDA